MSRYNYFCISIAFLLVLSCSESRNKVVTDDENVVNIKIQDIPPALIDAPNYIDSVRYIILEEGGEVPIADISEIFFTDSLLIISEYRQKAIFFFTHEGKYLRKISKRGRGPGEYITISNVMVDVDNKNVIIYDDNTKRLMFYDFNGTYIRTIDEFSDKAVIRDMINLPDGGFLCYRQDKLSDDTPGGMWYVGKNGKPGKYFYRLDKDYPSSHTQYPCNFYYLSDGKIGFSEIVFYDIYHYDQEGLHKIISYRLPGKNVSDFKGEPDSFAHNTASLVMTVESDRFAITEFLTDMMQYGMIIVDKEDNSYELGRALYGLSDPQLIVLTGTTVRNNLSGVRSSIINSNNLYSYLEHEGVPQNIRSFVNDNLTLGLNEEEIEGMNPIIQLLYIKNN